MKTKIIYFLILFSFLSCKEEKENKIDTTNKVSNSAKSKINQEQAVSISQFTTDYTTLINNVRKKGDIDSYDELFYGFMDSNKAERTDSLMIYSKIMAVQYNYEKAYIDYITALCEKNNIKFEYSNFSSINILLMDKTSKLQAEDWLKKMLEKKVITQEQYNSVKR